MVVALFGSSRQLASGPVAAVSLMTAAAVAPLVAGDPQAYVAYVAYAVVLALMVGPFQLGLGLLRLGVLVDFLSHPVVVGFMNAGAPIFATSQIGKLFGVTVSGFEHHDETVWYTIQAAMTATHWPTLAMGALAFACMFGLKSLAPKVPSVLVAVFGTTLIAYFAGFQKAGGQVVGEIPVGLPGVTMPSFDWPVLIDLLTAAVTIALIGFMAAMSIARRWRRAPVSGSTRIRNGSGSGFPIAFPVPSRSIRSPAPSRVRPSTSMPERRPALHRR
jgi:SulP family sulfate permease